MTAALVIVVLVVALVVSLFLVGVAFGANLVLRDRLERVVKQRNAATERGDAATAEAERQKAHAAIHAQQEGVLRRILWQAGIQVVDSADLLTADCVEEIDWTGGNPS